MKISICHLLQPPLLMLFCGYCLAKVQGKVDADSQSSIYKTNPQVKAMRSGLEVNKEISEYHSLIGNSSRADFPCPESAAIAPCTCTVEPDNRINIDCTFVESLDQLVAVFQTDFPVKELYQFTMANNSAVSGLPSFMNGVTFESVYLFPGPFILAAISDYFFFDLKDTLKDFTVQKSKLSTDFFPFFLLPYMNQLEELRLVYTDISWIPPIRAPKLNTFVLVYSPVELLTNGTFLIGTGPMSIWVHSNQIHTIEVGSFFFADQNSADSNAHIGINVFNNRLQSLKAGTFPLRNGPMTINLYSSQISSIEPGTFVLPASTDFLTISLYLYDNELATFEEAVFGSLMPYITNLYLSGNPLICGCDIAWLILNEDFLARVDDDATCADGTLLIDLDPQQFIDFC